MNPGLLIASLLWIERYGCEQDKTVAADGLRRFDLNHGEGLVTKLKTDTEGMAPLEVMAPDREGWSSSGTWWDLT